MLNTNRAGDTRLACLALACAGLLGACGGNPSGIGGPLSLGTGAAICDIDGDGRADVVAVGMYSKGGTAAREGEVYIYRQASAGAFAAPDIYTVGGYLWSVVCGDIDGDGAPDLVANDVEPPEALARGREDWFLRQDPLRRGQFLAPQPMLEGIDVFGYESAVADFNDDGAPDIAVGARNPPRLVVRYQNPAQRGTFLPPAESALPSSASDLTAADLNGDGLTDLSMSLQLSRGQFVDSYALGVSLQQPDGTFAAVTTMAPQNGLNVSRLGIADIDGDGRRDILAFFTPQSIDYRAKLTVVRQGSGGTYLAPVDTAVENSIFGGGEAIFADLNADGQIEVAIVASRPEYPSGNLEIKTAIGLFTLSGGGSFRLTKHDEFWMGDYIFGVSAGDIDGDGRTDLLVLGDMGRCFVLIQSHTVAGTFEAPRLLR